MWTQLSTVYPSHHIGKIKDLMHDKGYKLFMNDKMPYNLNIVAIRHKNPVVDNFNDELVVFWYYRGDLYTFSTAVTTLPGKYYLINRLLNIKGAAILVPGQYEKAYKLGDHKGYTALVQCQPVVVYRDGNRDTLYDYAPDTTDYGLYGINIHRAANDETVPKVGKYSAGCIVVQDPCNYEMFITLCTRSADVYGNRFTFTLLDDNDLNILGR